MCWYRYTIKLYDFEIAHVQNKGKGMNVKYITAMRCMLSQNFQNNLFARFC